MPPYSPGVFPVLDGEQPLHGHYAPTLHLWVGNGWNLGPRPQCKGEFEKQIVTERL